ncbi:ABC transporter ATP-binding protein [Ferroglobus sp.]|uniref:ABC transporter ATP-binding protein n=1 Tax=Ferroglobus sp. TaxID=2614230 RepID=UPI0025C2F7A1|nr:ABC transporter ATP-binding protein [Ferroglobus sp.]
MKLKVENVTVKIESKEILKDVTLEVESGEIVALLGPNGSGKSTLLRTIFGILKPVKGVVFFDGKRIDKIEVISKNVAYLPQESSDTNLTVLDVVLLGRTPHLSGFKLPKSYDLEISKKALEEVGMIEFAGRKFSELSGGEKQKVLLARVFAQQPKLMLLDEPTAHLDISAQIEIMEIVRRKVNSGCSALVAMHDINLASMFSDKIIMVKNGKVVYVGEAEEVLTEESIREVYGADVRIKKVGRSVYVIPKTRVKKNGKIVHIICGGGSGRDLIYLLSEEGYSISAGVLNVLDSDWEAVIDVGGEFVEEAPFSPISEEAHEKNLELIEKADVVVLSNLVVGKGNIKNLIAAKIAAELGKLIVVEKTRFKSRNFFGKQAEKIYEEIVKRARVVGSEREALYEIRKVLG